MRPRSAAILSCACLLLVVAFSVGPGLLADDAVFEHSIQSEAKPWTHLRFENRPEEFQFAILTDRTGGARPGVFPLAVSKLNLLGPEFVVCVGDLIEGYTENRAALEKEWEELTGFTESLRMPFFYTPGNHDISNETMQKTYEKMFGARYYAFRYRNVLFLCLDSQESSGEGTGLGKEQVAWALAEIEKNDSVRWTILLMHQPLWVYEEGGMRTARKEIGAGYATGFGRVQEVLADRPYTVFAGHFHQYTSFVRNERNCYILSTTGGGSMLRGPAFGEFDHAVWVTMSTNGPRIANLLLDGILEHDVHTEGHIVFEALDRVIVNEWGKIRSGTTASFPIINPFEQPLRVVLRWPEGMKDWSIDPLVSEAVAAAGKKESLDFSIRYDGKRAYPPVPTCHAVFTGGEDFHVERDLLLAFDVESFIQGRKPVVDVLHTRRPPTVDGKIRDREWRFATHITDFVVSNLSEPPKAETEAWISYDASALYIAVRNGEPSMKGIKQDVTERDGNIWEDDSVEIMIDANNDRRTYHQFGINARGALYDALVFDKTAFDGTGALATGRERAAWTLEIAIPWEDLGVDAPTDLSKMGFVIARTRMQEKQMIQFPPLNGWNHRRENYGTLTFAPSKGTRAR